MLREALINKRNLENSNKYARPFFMIEGLLEKHPYISPIAQQIAEFPNQFWHGTMVAQVYENVIGSLFTKGHLPQEKLGYYDSGTVSAFFHDIGKFGIDPAGINQSLAIMDHVSNSQEKARPGQDLRPTIIRATQCLHPLIGGYMVDLMSEMGLIPKGEVKIIDPPIFGHHETDNGFKSSYPRPNRILNNPNKTFNSLLIQLIDVAVGMREKRAYRDKLDFSVIEPELGLYLQNPELLKHVGLGINFPNKELRQTKDLRELLIKEVMGAVYSVDKIIREVPDLSLIEWNNLEGAENNVNNLLLEDLIAKVWATKQDRILKTYQDYLARDYYHATRK
jgi:hypothetical protein